MLLGIWLKMQPLRMQVWMEIKLPPTDFIVNSYSNADDSFNIAPLEGNGCLA